MNDMCDNTQPKPEDPARSERDKTSKQLARDLVRLAARKDHFEEKTRPTIVQLHELDED